jgi:hypothetical protein
MMPASSSAQCSLLYKSRILCYNNRKEEVREDTLLAQSFALLFRQSIEH